LSFGATFLIFLFAFVVSEVKPDFARDGTLPQSRTTKWRRSLDALLWCAGRPHSPASLNAT
jgi:hypothetical protein